MEHEELLRWYWELLIYPIRLPFEETMKGKYQFDGKQLRDLVDMDALITAEILDDISSFEKSLI